MLAAWAKLKVVHKTQLANPVYDVYGDALNSMSGVDN